MLNEKYLINNNDKYVKLKLFNEYDIYFDENDINLISEAKVEENINPYLDSEKIRFKFKQELVNKPLSFAFKSGTTFGSTYRHAGFTQTELNQNESSFINSFYAVEVYDSVNSKTQNLLSTTYIKPITSNLYTGSTSINYLTTDEQTKILIPKDFLLEQSGTSRVVYFKYSFYNAKTGRIVPFYFDNLFPRSGETIFYNQSTLDLTGKTYTLTDSILTKPFKEFSNIEYVENINDKFDSVQNKKLTYPTGTTFTASGTYI
jgi:hypothetical protein